MQRNYFQMTVNLRIANIIERIKRARADLIKEIPGAVVSYTIPVDAVFTDAGDTNSVDGRNNEK